MKSYLDSAVMRSYLVSEVIQSYLVSALMKSYLTAQLCSHTLTVKSCRILRHLSCSWPGPKVLYMVLFQYQGDRILCSTSLLILYTARTYSESVIWALTCSPMAVSEHRHLSLGSPPQQLQGTCLDNVWQSLILNDDNKAAQP